MNKAPGCTVAPLPGQGSRPDSLSLAQLRTIIEYSSDTLFVTDGNGVTLLTNTAYERVSGASRTELLGRNINDFTGILFSESGSALAIRHRKTVTFEQKMLRTNRHIYVTSHPVFNDQGDIVLVVSTNRDFTELEQLRQQLADTQGLVSRYKAEIEAIKSQRVGQGGMIAKDKKTLDVLYKLHKSACFDSTVLLLGETGTGKEEFAAYLHAVSDRKNRPFVKVNCGAIADTLMESEFFGYEPGAFTGAKSTGKAGLFELADTGSIFLDEIGELPLELQVKLLRVLQDREVTRLGGTRPVKVDVRVIAATNGDLETMVARKLFREDLYYRLNVIRVEVPPLRLRRDDVIPLARHFLEAFNHRHGLRKSLSTAAYHALLQHDWPGNVRELRNVIEHAVVLGRSDRILADDLPLVGVKPRATGAGDGPDLEDLISRLEYYHINKAYAQCGSLRDAAASLGLSTTTYVRKRDRYRLRFGAGGMA